MGIRVVPLKTKEEKKRASIKASKESGQRLLDALGILPHETKLPKGMKRRTTKKRKVTKPLVKTISLSSGGQIGNFNGDKFVSSYYELIE